MTWRPLPLGAIGITAMLAPLMLWHAPAFADDNGQAATFDDDCPTGMFLAGLNVRSGDWLDKIGIRCATFDSANEVFGVAADVGHPMFGGDGGSAPRKIDCGPHMAVVGIVGNMTRAPDAGHVDNMFMACNPANPANSNYSYIVVNTDPGSSDSDIVGDLIAFNDSGDEDNSMSLGSGISRVAFPGCDSGSFAIGIKGTTFEHAVEDVDLDCQNLEDGRIGTVSTPLSVAPPSPLDVLGSLASKGPSFTIAKTPAGPCTGPVNGNYLCPYTITVTNTGALNYSGPITFVDKSGYQHDPVTFGGISQFACSGTADPLVVKYAKTAHLLTCSANTIVPAGSSVTATAVATISGGDAAMSACGNVANSVSLKAPVDIGPVWAHATLPGSSDCSPSATTTDGVIPPECPFGWYRVHDQSRLPATWVRQQLTMNEISILCAKPSSAATINPSKLIKVIPSPTCPLGQKPGNNGCEPVAATVPLDPSLACLALGKEMYNGLCAAKCGAGQHHEPPTGACVNNLIIPRTPNTRLESDACPDATVRVGHSCVPACPDGSIMPANGYCGPKIILKPSDLLPCSNGQLRQADGSCPAPQPPAPSPTLNLRNDRKLLACPDGQARLEDSQCPPPMIKIRPFILNRSSSNNGLH